METPYIGASISLISKSEIRYEGILFTIDTKDSNIALQNVRSFGTEGRKSNGPQIPPSNEVYDYIIFRGSDIKDLHVMDQAPQSSAQQLDPAIVNAPSISSGYGYPPPYGQPPGGYPRGPPPGAPGMWGQPPAYPGAPGMMPQYGGGPAPPQWGPSGYYLPQQQQQMGAPQMQGSNGPPKPEAPMAVTPSAPARPAGNGQAPQGSYGGGANAPPPRAPAPTVSAAPKSAGGAPPAPVLAPAPVVRPRPSSYAGAAGAVQSQASAGAQAAGRGPANGAARPGRGAVPAPGGRGYGRSGPGGPPAAIVVPAEDFDFASNLQKFKKSAAVATQAAVSTYNKDDFFDQISSDVVDKSAAEDRNRHRYDADRRVNLETFGALNLGANSSINRPRPAAAGGRGPAPGRGAPGPGGRGAGGFSGGRGGRGGATDSRGGGEARRSVPAPRAGAGRGAK